MKRTYLIYLIISFFVLSGCNKDDFLEKLPLDAVSPESYFKTANHFKLYLNQFYNDLGGFGSWGIGYFGTDNGTDNQVATGPNSHLNGQTVKGVSDANWTNNYSRIRNINYLLENTQQATWNDIKSYVGEARFFRAFFYFSLLQRFGDVPYINRCIPVEDREALKTPRSPRNAVADSIIADLDFAISNLPEKAIAEKFRLNKEAALAFKARVCLYEGTWEKYHGKKGTPFKVNGSDGTKYLQLALDASEKIIQGNKFSIDKNGSEPYYSLFNSIDFSSSSEVILWRKQIRGLGVSQNVAQILIYGTSYGLTKELIEDYLFLDGKPLSLTSLVSDDANLNVLVANRDPRLGQSVMYPGVPNMINDADGKITAFVFPYLPKVPTGYKIRKGFLPYASNIASGQDQVAYIHFRYGEVLLNYIEAKAELSESGKATLNQNDIDITINKIRDRIGMPHLLLNSPIVDPDDPMTGILPWYLVEIRRERRIELAVEGYRFNDIFRWAAADILIKGKIFHGAPYKWHYDNNFLGARSYKKVNPQGILSPWYGTAIDTQGGYAFNLSRDYLFPIPMQEVTLAEYIQNPGWE